MVIEVGQGGIELCFDTSQPFVVLRCHTLTLYVFCDFDKPLVVLVLVHGNKTFVVEVFYAGQEVFFFGSWVHYAGQTLVAV